MGAFEVILIDPSDARDVLAERLHMQGYAVRVTASPIEGASFALADPPAAVIADLWMPGISGVQLARLLRAEVATERVPVILRGPEGDRQNRFWAERAGAAAYVGQGRMGELVRALAAAIAANPPTEDSFMQAYGGEEFELRNRIAAHLDTALFESVLAAEVRALSVCGSFARLPDLLSQFVSRVTSYRWLAVYTGQPERLGLHAHPNTRAQCEEEARRFISPVSGSVVASRCDSSTRAAMRSGPASSRATIDTSSLSLGCGVSRGASPTVPITSVPRQMSRTIGGAPATSA